MSIGYVYDGPSDRAALRVDEHAPLPWRALSTRVELSRSYPQPGDYSLSDVDDLPEDDFDVTWQTVDEAWANARAGTKMPGDPRDGFGFGYRNLWEDEALGLVLVPCYLVQMHDQALALEQARNAIISQNVTIADGASYGSRIVVGDASLLASVLRDELSEYQAVECGVRELLRGLEDNDYSVAWFVRATRELFAKLVKEPERAPVAEGKLMPSTESMTAFASWGARLWEREQLLLMGVSLVGSPDDIEAGIEMLEEWLRLGLVDDATAHSLAMHAPVGRFNEEWFRPSRGA